MASSEPSETFDSHVKAWQEDQLNREAAVRESNQRFEAEMSRIMAKVVDKKALSSREHMLLMRRTYLEAVFMYIYALLVLHSCFTSLDICNCCNPALLEYIHLYSCFTRTLLVLFLLCVCACAGLLAS